MNTKLIQSLGQKSQSLSLPPTPGYNDGFYGGGKFGGGGFGKKGGFDDFGGGFGGKGYGGGMW